MLWGDVMLRFWHVIAVSTFVALLFGTAHADVSDEAEDLVDIFHSNGEIIAVLEGKRSVSVGLRPNEQIQWSGAKGNLGAFLSDRNFFVISTLSGGWQKLPLRSGDSTKRVAVLSSNIGLLVDRDRALAFSVPSNRFIETRFSRSDELVSLKADRYIAVVVTTSKAFGFFPGASRFSEIRLGAREAVEHVKITRSKATIRTSQRILSFRTGGTNWKEHRL